MAAKAAAETKERYEVLCKQNEIEPHPYIMKKLTAASTDILMNSTDALSLDLSGNGTLETAERVGVKGQRIADVDVETLCTLLSRSTALSSLDLRYNNLTDKSANALAKLLKESTSLRELNLMGNDITEEGIKIIAKALHGNKILQSLRLTGNKIGNKGGMHIAQALQINNSLRHIDLGDCDLHIESIVAMSTVLTKNSNLRAVVLNRPMIFSHQEEQAVHIGHMLTINNTLTELHLEKFSLRDFGVERLVDGLLSSYNYSLKYLNISSNRLSRDSGPVLAKLLAKNTPLQILDVSNNRLEKEGLAEIAAALTTANTKLKALSVRYNEAGGAGLVSIANSLKKNQSLTNLFIWGNENSIQACAAIGQLMAKKRLLEAHTDVRAYIVNGEVKLAEVSHGLRRFYYWTPTHGPDVHPYQAPIHYPCSVGDGVTEPAS